MIPFALLFLLAAWPLQASSSLRQAERLPPPRPTLPSSAQALSPEEEKSWFETVFQGDIPLLQAYLEHNTSLAPVLLNARHSHIGRTPLMVATEHGPLEVMEFLVGQGAQIDLPTPGGKTALMLAAGNNALHKVKYLMEQGAQQAALEAKGWNALCIAAVRGHRDVVCYLASRSTPEEVNHLPYSYGDSPLGYAARASDPQHALEMVQALVKAGADVHQTHERAGTTPLASAAARGNLALASFLVGLGVPVCPQEKGQPTPLFYAAGHKGGLSMVKYLLDQGTHVNLTDRHGHTALHKVAAQGGRQVAAYLITRGADIDKGTQGGETSLMLASSRRAGLPMVKVLLHHGARVNARSTTGETAFLLAIQYEFLDIAEYLLEQGAQEAPYALGGELLKEVLYNTHAIYKQPKALVKLLMRAGVSPWVASDPGGYLIREERFLWWRSCQETHQALDRENHCWAMVITCWARQAGHPFPKALVSLKPFQDYP